MTNLIQHKVRQRNLLGYEVVSTLTVSVSTDIAPRYVGSQSVEDRVRDGHEKQLLSLVLDMEYWEMQRALGELGYLAQIHDLDNCLNKLVNRLASWPAVSDETPTEG